MWTRLKNNSSLKRSNHRHSILLQEAQIHSNRMASIQMELKMAPPRKKLTKLLPFSRNVLPSSHQVLKNQWKITSHRRASSWKRKQYHHQSLQTTKMRIIIQLEWACLMLKMKTRMKSHWRNRKIRNVKCGNTQPMKSNSSKKVKIRV